MRKEDKGYFSYGPGESFPKFEDNYFLYEIIMFIYLLLGNLQVYVS